MAQQLDDISVIGGRDIGRDKFASREGRDAHGRGRGFNDRLLIQTDGVEGHCFGVYTRSSDVQGCSTGAHYPRLRHETQRHARGAHRQGRRHRTLDAELIGGAGEDGEQIGGRSITQVINHHAVRRGDDPKKAAAQVQCDGADHQISGVRPRTLIDMTH